MQMWLHYKYTPIFEYSSVLTYSKVAMSPKSEDKVSY
jgi:hypothetical protein